MFFGYFLHAFVMNFPFLILHHIYGFLNDSFHAHSVWDTGIESLHDGHCGLKPLVAVLLVHLEDLLECGFSQSSIPQEHLPLAKVGFQLEAI